jgi:hypothetical protein
MINLPTELGVCAQNLEGELLHEGAKVAKENLGDLRPERQPRSA